MSGSASLARTQLLERSREKRSRDDVYDLQRRAIALGVTPPRPLAMRDEEKPQTRRSSASVEFTSL